MLLGPYVLCGSSFPQIQRARALATEHRSSGQGLVLSALQTGLSLWAGAQAHSAASLRPPEVRGTITKEQAHLREKSAGGLPARPQAGLVVNDLGSIHSHLPNVVVSAQRSAFCEIAEVQGSSPAQDLLSKEP